MLRPLFVAGSTIILTLALVGCGSDSSPTTPSATNSFTDSRDGTVYPTVTIGTQVWFARNLNYKGTGSDTSGVCWGNLPSNCATYGRLYSWAEAMGLATSYNSTSVPTTSSAVQGVCPAGWHIPSEAEWAKLDTTVKFSANRLKSVTWDGNDSSGFGALPAGSKQYSGSFAVLGSVTYFWTTGNHTSDEGIYWYLSAADNAVHYFSYFKTSALSVRCLKN
jgi:uncharacterized protein (TIGR02145 family)